MTDCGCTNFPANLGNVTFGASVGIGTTAPTVPLHVVGIRIRLESAEDGRLIDLRTDGDGVDLQGVGADLYINAGVTHNTYVNTDGGSVGIGTTLPQAKLEVAGGAVRVGGREVIDTDGYALYG